LPTRYDPLPTPHIPLFLLSLSLPDRASGTSIQYYPWQRLSAKQFAAIKRAKLKKILAMTPLAGCNSSYEFAG